MARGQPPVRGVECNEALCCALRSALCLGQPPARGVDAQCDGALRCAVPREPAWGSKLPEAC